MFHFLLSILFLMHFDCHGDDKTVVWNEEFALTFYQVSNYQLVNQNAFSLAEIFHQNSVI